MDASANIPLCEPRRTLATPLPFGGLLAGSFATGLVAGDHLELAASSVVAWALSLALAAAVLPAAWRRGRRRASATAPRPSRPHGARALGWCAIFVALGAARTTSTQPTRAHDAVNETHASVAVVTRGVIDDVPLLLAGRDRPYIAFALLAPSGDRYRVRVGDARSVPQGWRAGSPVEIRARRYALRSHRAGRDRRGTAHLLRVTAPAAVRVLSDRTARELQLDDGGPLPGFLRRLRQSIHDVVRDLYDERARGLLLAMLLGDRRLLDRTMWDSMLATGTLHFLAISGLHVSLLMLIVVRLPLPRGARMPMRLLFLAVFSLLTGANAPVVRAALMFAVHIVLRGIGRRPTALNTLGWTALLLLAIDPLALADPGFQLSFVAVAAIVTWGRELDGEERRRRIAGFLPRPPPGGPIARAARAIGRWGRRSLAVSVATNVATAPILLAWFHRLHPTAPISTLAVYPLAVVVLLGGFVSVGLGLVATELGAAVAVPTALAVDALAVVVGCAAELPGACVWLPPPAPWQIAGSYAVLVLGWAPNLRGRTLAAATIALVAAAIATALVVPQTIAIVHVDVGAASATVLRGPRGGTWLIDAGDLPGREGRSVVEAVLEANGRTVDGALITHPDADHVGALPRVVETLGVRHVLTSPFFEAAPSGDAALSLARDAGLRVDALSRGDGLEVGAFRLEVLHPAASETLPFIASKNDTSLCVRVTVAGTTLLLLGDIEEAGIARLLPHADELAADVLVLPHHGRRNRLLDAIVDASGARTVVISGDGRGGARENATALEARGIEVFATWRGGSVVHEIVDGRLETRYAGR